MKMSISTTAEHLADGAAEVSAKSEAAMRRKASQLQKFFDDVEELLRRVSSLEDSEISRLRSGVESSIKHVKAAARDGSHAAIESTRTAALATDEYVHRKPWIAVGASAAVGALIGALLARK
jgi:ElaB/YqjD/DUF883 family membrane-anchored ribosome-binding protein